MLYLNFCYMLKVCLFCCWATINSISFFFIYPLFSETVSKHSLSPHLPLFCLSTGPQQIHQFQTSHYTFFPLEGCIYVFSKVTKLTKDCLLKNLCDSSHLHNQMLHWLKYLSKHHWRSVLYLLFCLGKPDLKECVVFNLKGFAFYADLSWVVLFRRVG